MTTGLTATIRRCAGLRFAPLPQLVSGVEPGWRPVGELDLDSVDAVLQAELADCPAGPHAVHGLRSLTREMIWAQSAAIGLTGAGASFRSDDWLVSGIGLGPGSVRHRLLESAATPVAAEVAADALVSVVTPIVEAVRESSRVGRRTLWSYVVDTASLAMLVLARQLGQDRTAAWQRAQQWSELLFAAGIPRLSQPQLARYGEGNSNIWGVRGACCLDFKDPEHGFCLTCPVLDHTERAELWSVSDLASIPGSAGPGSAGPRSAETS